jgi:hypothetical protein
MASQQSEGARRQLARGSRRPSRVGLVGRLGAAEPDDVTGKDEGNGCYKFRWNNPSDG